MIDNINKSDTEIIKILKYYVPNKWHDLNNWYIILSRATWINKDLVLFKCSFLELYFNKDMIIQEYGNIKIIDNEVFYDISDTLSTYAGEISLGTVYDGSDEDSIIDREDLKKVLNKYNSINGV